MLFNALALAVWEDQHLQNEGWGVGLLFLCGLTFHDAVLTNSAQFSFCFRPFVEYSKRSGNVTMDY